MNNRGDRDAFEELADRAPVSGSGAAGRDAVEELAPARLRRDLDESVVERDLEGPPPVENTITVQICHQLTADDDPTADLGVVADVEIDEFDLDPMAD